MFWTKVKEAPQQQREGYVGGREAVCMAQDLNLWAVTIDFVIQRVVVFRISNPIVKNILILSAEVCRK